MFTRRQYAEEFFEKVENRYNEKMMYSLRPSLAMDSYINLLESISAQRNYKEGQKIDPDDLKRIQDSVKSIISATADRISAGKGNRISTGYFDASESFSSLMLMNDYLFAMAQKELGCPDMPANFGTEVEQRISDAATEADTKLNQASYDSLDSDKRYNKQRRIDADKLIEKNQSLSDRLDKKPTSLEVAQYAAEYQALKRRQENHTRVWKFFHKGENIKRTALLAEMKEKLERVLGSGIDVDGKKPSDLAKIQHDRALGAVSDKAFKPEELGKRYGGYDPSQFEYTEQRENEAISENEELHRNLQNDIEKGSKSTEIKGKVDEIDPQVRTQNLTN